MPAATTSLTVRDETLHGDRTNELTLEFLTERITVRELIRSRIYQEVTEFNAAQAGVFRGLVQPKEAAKQRRIDWAAQFERAVEGFGRNRFLILVDDRQVTELDEEFDLRHDTSVTFLKLVPLVGG